MQDFMTFLSNHLTLTYTLAATLLLLMVVEFLRLKRHNVSIDVPKAVQLINREQAVVIDIRPKDLYRKGHIIDAHSISAKEMQENTKKMDKFKTRPLILVCARGNESQKITILLRKQGYNAYSLSGGISAWITTELPLVKE